MKASQECKEGHLVPDFIRKLVEIMEKYPKIICFNQNGKQICVQDHVSFTEIVLPAYFRHTQWKSFIRQMNMYDFKKLNRGYNCFIFVNSIFYRGNEQNYHLIKRKIKTKSKYLKEVQNYEKKIRQSLEYEYPNTSVVQLLERTIEFRAKSVSCYSQMKKIIDYVCKERKTQDSKQISQGVKDSIQLIQEVSAKFTQSIQTYCLENYNDSQDLSDQNNAYGTPDEFDNLPHHKIQQMEDDRNILMMTPNLTQTNKDDSKNNLDDQLNCIEDEFLCSFNSVMKLINL